MEKFTPSYLTTFLFIHDCPKILNKDKTSYLRPKIKRLRKLENRYIEKGFGQIKLNDSDVIKGIMRTPEKQFKDSVRYRVKNVNDFKNSVYKINLVYVQRTKNLKGIPYPKIKIEEIIFNSETCAKVTLSYIKHARSIAYFWDDIDKSPSFIFREENRIYFISSRGRHLKKFYQTIAKTIKD